MQILLATSNSHKIEEIKAILAPLGIEVLSLDSIDIQIEEPEENGETFRDNAAIKAVAYAKAIGKWCIADDSGLEVDALNGRPGVHSARYAGIGNNRDDRDQLNNQKLLEELKDVPQTKRSARFVCAMCLADNSGNTLAETCGTFEGFITDKPQGENGFGYDPLLYLPDANCTSAELTPEEKNARSHRGEASRLMAEKIRQLQI